MGVTLASKVLMCSFISCCYRLCSHMLILFMFDNLGVKGWTENKHTYGSKYHCVQGVSMHLVFVTVIFCSHNCVELVNVSYHFLTINSNNLSTNWSAALEHVLPDKNTFLRLHTFDLVWSKQQVLVGNRRLFSLWLAVSSKSSLKWYRECVLVSWL